MDKTAGYYIALNVKDIRRSFEFYSLLGFELAENSGSIEDKWVMMKRGKSFIGLFQDMFDQNIMTFQLGHIRDLYHFLGENNVSIRAHSESILKSSGPANFMVNDPDGNVILFDEV
jgi:catechol 2,3-dioxygenase-like lactoylglutathione lyase family enzyme